MFNAGIADWLSNAAVAVGVVLLLLSLRPFHAIHLRAKQYSRAWRLLFVLSIFFVLGYAVFLALSFGQRLLPIEWIVSVIFMCGALFVWMVAKISRSTIDEMSRIVASERYRSNHDVLTGLPNRQFFVNHIDGLLKQEAQLDGDKPFALFIMDLNRFKLVNDTVGHVYGDVLLQDVAARIRKVVGNDALLSRIGGDEFGLLVQGISGPRATQNLATNIRRAMEPAFVVRRYPTDIDISIGIAAFPQNGRESQLLVKRAEIAMYAAKDMPENVAHYMEHMDNHNVNHLSILGELRQAIEANELVIHYQPQVNLQSGAVAGVEALVRWPHKKYGLMPPDEFLPIAEQSSLINQLNHWVMSRVMEQMEVWAQKGILVPVSINISMKNLLDPSCYQRIVQGLQDAALSPDLLRLEITESAMMQDPERSMELISRLSKQGIRFSIDDFGTGYSSLSYLKQLCATEIKIDKSFVLDMLDNENDAVIVRATIDLAHNMGHTVVAEGVENQDMLDILRVLGCNLAQGYYLSRPLTPEAYEAWIQQAEQQLEPLVFGRPAQARAGAGGI